jgi:hypothetical protein
MGELARDFDLAEEAIVPERLTQLGSEDLYRDRSLVLEITGEKDHRHATPAELTRDCVAISEGQGEAVLQIGHVYSR